MALAEKEATVKRLVDKFSAARGVYLADFMGLNVEEISDLRNQLRQEAIELKVVKNTLARISAEQVGLDQLVDYLTGPTALAFCLADPIVGAKILTGYQKKNEKLKLKACVLDGQVYDQKRISDIAKLPPVNQIRGQAIGVMAAPLRNMVGLLTNVLQSMVNVLTQIKNKQES